MYERPSTSQVDAFSRPARNMAMPQPQEMRVQVGANGRLIDYGRTVGQSSNTAGEIAGFLDGLVKIGAPVYKQYLEGQGQAQATKLFSEGLDPGQFARMADADQRNLLRSVNPFADQIILDAAARASSTTYVETLAAERARSVVLKNYSAPPEVRAKEDARIRSVALEASGAGNIQGPAMAPYLPQIAEAEAKLRADTYKEQLQAKATDADRVFEKSQIPALRALAINVLQPGLIDKGGQGDNGQGRVMALNFRRNYRDTTEAGFYTPNQYAERTYNAINETLGQFLAEDNLPAAMGLLRGMRAVMETDPIQTPGGVSLWDIRVGPNGESISTSIRAREASMLDEYEKWQRKQRIAGFGPLLVRAAQGDPEATALINQMLPTFANDPEGLSQIVGVAGQMQEYGQRPTPAQLEQQAALEIELNEPGRSRTELNQRILSSNLTPQQKINLLRSNTEPTNKALELGATGREGSREWQAEATVNIVQAKVSAGLIPADTKSIENEAERINREMTIEATKKTEEWIKQRQAAGESVSTLEAAERYRAEVDTIQKRELQTITKGTQNQPKTFTQTVMDEVNYVQEQMKRTRGELTINLFPKSTLDAARRDGVPMNARAVRDYQLQRMRSVQGPDGKPLFPDVNKTYRDMQRRSRGEQPQVQAPPGVPTGGRIGSELGYPATPPRSTPRNGNQSSSNRQPQSQLTAFADTTRQIVMGTLDALMGVRPAVAAGGGGKGAQPPSLPAPAAAPRNAENLDVMASLWARRRRMDSSTPPLPQVAATAPTVRLPLAINTQAHPIFVAIGIAEGTRTPNGGFTKAYFGHRDPADKNWNRGTVSGGRGSSASPAQVDQQWMARLTRQAMGVAPVLMRMGLREGTAGWNRLMFNVLDLAVQAPLAVPDFIRKLPQVLRQGATIEAIAKARADSFINPATGRLEAGGFENSYSRLLRDQRSRAGAFDYKRRL